MLTNILNSHYFVGPSSFFTHFSEENPLMPPKKVAAKGKKRSSGPVFSDAQEKELEKLLKAKEAAKAEEQKKGKRCLR